jgi:NAD(P)-dependent dehydrogenase (short-subunit alcohol dehydrogenase family)
MRPRVVAMLRATGGGFAGRIAFVTGGASGIGAALGAELVKHGAHVTLADLDGEGAQRVAAHLDRGGPGTARGVGLDVRDADAFAATVDEVGAIDFLFNNAGISLGGPTHELTKRHWDAVIDVNLRGVVNGILAAYPAMVARGTGHIINTASAAGLAAPPFVAPYAATKHAVVGLSTSLRPEAALHGVRVSVLCPGSVETPILDRDPSPDLPPTASAPVTARAYLALARQKPVPADDLARQTLERVARNRGIIVLPTTARILWYLNRLSPALMGPATARLAGRVDRSLVRPR